MKNILLVAVTMVSLFLGAITGDYTVFMLAFAFSSFAAAKANMHSNILAACVSTCELGAIQEDDDCNTRGGIKTVYWTEYSNIDWAAMAGNVLNFTPATSLILDYIMVAAATFTKLTFDRKQAFYNFTYTRDADLYAQVITMIFKGKSNANKEAFKKALKCCKVVAHIFDNNCLERVVGVEWDGATFEPQLTTLRIGRHLDASGQFGTDIARDELDLTGESLFPPLFATVGEENMPV